MRHPGRRIREGFLEPLGIRPSQLARAMGVDRSTVGRLLGEQQSMTPALAARLGACLGVPARWFLQMQAEYDAERIEGDPRLAEGASVLDIGDDWLLSPDGAIALGGVDPPESGHGVRTVQLDNGAMALLGGGS